jgi:two-component system sensor histidine kinase VanS
MKRKTFFGIYAKVMSYTLLILLVVVIVAAAFFSGQISATLENMERQQLSNIFAPLMEQLGGKSDEEVISLSEDFHAKNAAFEFYVQNEDGEIIYKTPGAIILGTENEIDKLNDDVYFYGKEKADNFQMSMPLPSGISVYMSAKSSGGTVYQEFVQKTIIVLLSLFVIGGLAASAFAYRITRPIKTLARDTKRMSELEFVPPPVARRDEIGQLAKDVYRMYEDLKAEIEREREMEESQRYFFSAASHELKTPIASTLILLQGMLDNVGEYKDHPQYLRECIKKMKAQSKMISEILEIVRLTDGRIVPSFEKTELADIVHSVMASHQTLSEAKEQKIIADLPGTVTCNADRNMLVRVLSNVILNAVQNTPEKGEIQIYTENQGDGTIRLSVLNKGVSINEETLSKIFEPFYREDKARSSGQGRSGLGLAIVKKTLDCMAIPFDIENTEQGVLFWMDLPVYSE